jgi:steroid delta-isomerase
MKNILILCFVWAATGCVSPRSPQQQNSVSENPLNFSAQKIIEQSLRNWTESFNRRDLESVMDLFAPDLVASHRGQPDRNYNELRELLKKSLESTDLQFRYELEIEEIIVDRDMAVVRLIWTLTTEQNGQRETSRDRGLDVFRRQRDGKWRIVRFLSFPMDGP